MTKQISLETVLNARRVLDHAACSMPPEFYELAKKEYINQLKLYENETTNKEAFKLFANSERQRIKLLTQLNSSGPVDERNRTDQEIRLGSPHDGSTNPNV